MTTVPLTQCCSMLAIDAKTLQQWLKHSKLSLYSHPTDAPIKSLTMEQVQLLATLHGRSIKLDAVTPSPSLDADAPSLVQPEIPTHLQLARDATHVQTVGSLSQDPNLVHRLAQLEATINTMQQQLAQIALQMLQERKILSERLQQVSEALIQQTGGQTTSPQAIQTIEGDAKPDAQPRQERHLHPAEQRARARALPLIKYGTQGTYVVTSRLEGELPLTPDSTEWFDWLGSLSSFRFVGQQGHFSAYQTGSSRRWVARRFLDSRTYTFYLGVTNHLTIDHLEQIATKFQLHMTSL